MTLKTDNWQKVPLKWVEEPGGAVALFARPVNRRRPTPDHAIQILPETGALIAQSKPHVTKS